jgi:uncharacterized protein (DUF1800 family)
MSDPLAPYAPSAAHPWDDAAAAHLARRAGFGATPGELAELVGLGLDAAVESFVAIPERDEQLEQDLRRAGSALDPGERKDGRDGVQRLRRRWLFRMVHGRFPLHEKLTLLWHDHFATAESKVLRPALIERQLNLLHARAAGPFRALLGDIARDPAMLVLLDNRLNERASPNENWARELVELYALGRDQYSQGDVVALARIFTGWTTPAAHVPEFIFRPEWHDSGDKVLFAREFAGRAGEAGIEEGELALDRIVARDACPAFLAGKLARWFVRHDPEPEPVARLAQVLRETNLDIGATLSVLFRSRWFHEPRQRFALYKNPVELAVGTLRLLEVQNAHLAGLERLTRTMGMQLYEPPSVAGWEHGEGWIDSGALIQRFNFALEVSQLPHTRRQVEGRPALNLDSLAGAGLAGTRLAGTGLARTGLARTGDPSPELLLDRLSARLLGRPLSAAGRAAVLEVLANEEDPRARTRAALHLVLTAPQYAQA